MQNGMMQAGFTMVNVFHQIISFLVLGAYIAGLVACILNRRLSRAMIMCIVGFGGEIAVWVLDHLIGALGGLGSLGPDGILIIQFLGVFVSIFGAISLGILVLGLFRVFGDLSDRLGLRRGDGRADRRRQFEDDNDEDDRPARPRRSGGRGIEQ